MSKEEIHKELDLIQDVIRRMASNSFEVKKWLIGILTAIVVFKHEELLGGHTQYILLLLIPVFSFWYLDAFFLKTERQYREIYDWVVRNRPVTDKYLYDMKSILVEFTSGDKIWKVAWSRTIRIFYIVPVIFILVYTFLQYCNNHHGKISCRDDGKISVTFLQLNDVYEISSLDHGEKGGMARVASLRKELCRQNSNTYTVLSGDFLSPAALSTAKAGKVGINGRQMVDAMNATGIDLVTFGNHEFDLEELDLADRINQSCFDWVSTNVKQASGEKFTKTKNNKIVPVPETRILTFTDKDGTKVKIGIFGITINSTEKDYVKYEAYDSAAARAVQELKGKCNFIVAVTHLSRAEDIRLAEKFPEIKLIMGGHEHVHSIDTIFSAGNFVTKADANARTAYVHSLQYNACTHEVDIHSKLVPVDKKDYTEDADVMKKVNEWNKRAHDYWVNDDSIWTPCTIVKYLGDSIIYDGTEANTRSKETNLTRDIAAAVYKDVNAKNKVEAVIYNSGSLRLDDYITQEVKVYDIIRTLPYPATILTVQMKGFLLENLLKISNENKQNGCFLQHYNISANSDSSIWMINGKQIEQNREYSIALNDFLLSGKQEKMEFLKPGCKGLGKIDSSNTKQMKKMVIDYMSGKKNPTQKTLSTVPCY